MARLRAKVGGEGGDQQVLGNDPTGTPDGGIAKQFDPTAMGQAAHQESGGFQLPQTGGEGDQVIANHGPISDPLNAQSGETPRERGSAQASLRRPSTPTPMAGSVSQGASLRSPMPFQPMEGGSDSMMVAGQGGMGGGSLFGKAGGLQGGGLGTPLDPMSNQMSNPIIGTLIKLLKGMR